MHYEQQQKTMTQRQSRQHSARTLQQGRAPNLAALHEPKRIHSYENYTTVRRQAGQTANSHAHSLTHTGTALTTHANTIVDVHRSCRKKYFIRFLFHTCRMQCSVFAFIVAAVACILLFLSHSALANASFLLLLLASLRVVALRSVCSLPVRLSRLLVRLCSCVRFFLSVEKYIFWFLVCCDRIVVDSLSSSNDEKIIFSSNQIDILLNFVRPTKDK